LVYQYGDHRSKTLESDHKWSRNVFLKKNATTAAHSGVAKRRNKRPENKGLQLKKNLFDIVWWRVILDEAHLIKNRFGTIHQSCKDLAARHRWCLTGTPVQAS
jgi:SNF2 family DNA or RNA helicase